MDENASILLYTFMALVGLVMLATFVYMIYKVIKFFVKDAINRHTKK